MVWLWWGCLRTPAGFGAAGASVLHALPLVFITSLVLGAVPGN